MVDPRNPQGYRNPVPGVLVNATGAKLPDPCDQCQCDPCECSQQFSSDFGLGMQPGCDVPCIDHCVGDLLVHASAAPYECLPWAADTSCDDDWEDYDEANQTRALALAWRTIKTLTAGRIAAGCTTLRPCLTEDACDTCQDGSWNSPINPVLIKGEWFNWPCRPPDCSCCNVCELVMPSTVAAILEVNIDGYRHDPRLFRIDNMNRLVRQDGCCWPGCQNMGAPYGYYGTFGIHYVPGVPPRADGLWAVGILASEFAKSCSGGKCRLPTAVTSISRQGVSMEITQGMFEDGTGIREVDAYIHSLNPNRLKTPPRVWTPDQPKHRITTGTTSGVWP